MKKLMFRITCLFMAFAVLFSSTGYGMFEHTCNFTQKVTYSLHQEAGCCADDDVSSGAEGTSVRQSKCCSLSQEYNRVSVNQLNVNTEVFGGILAPVFCEIVSYSTRFLLYDEVENLPDGTDSPPPSTKLILALYQTYVI